MRLGADVLAASIQRAKRERIADGHVFIAPELHDWAISSGAMKWRPPSRRRWRPMHCSPVSHGCGLQGAGIP
jgi:hypothetical protein